MRVNYTILTGVFLLILLYLLSGKVSAQTASSKPMSTVITQKIQEQLDLKPVDGNNQDNASNQRKLPSGNSLPRQAEEAKKLKPSVAQRNPGKPETLPSTAPVDVEQIKNRNYNMLNKVKNRQQ